MNLSKEISAENIYFELQAYWGITKHMGGLKATDELIALCHITLDKYVLVVGCGIGLTSCYMAKKYRCRVLGVDISAKMIEWSRKRARKAGVTDRAEFMLADVQDLPFDDNLFDAVISESATAFPPNKERAVSEYVRVTKPGGYIGLNECAWLKEPPPELNEYMSRTTGGQFFTTDGWQELTAGAGLRDMTVRTYKINALSQWFYEVRQFDSSTFFRAWYQLLSQYIKSPSFRRIIKEKYLAGLSLRIFRQFFQYLGYGILIGQK